MIKDIKKIFFLLPAELKVKFFFLLIFIILGTFFEMLSVALLIPILNIMTGSVENIVEFLNNNNLNFLINFIETKKILLIFLFIFIFKTFFRLFLVHYQNIFIFSFFTHLLNGLYKKYIFKDYLFHVENNTSKLIRNLVSEIHQVSVGYMGAVTSIILEIIIISGLMGILLYYKPFEVLSFVFVTSIITLLMVKILNNKSKTLGENRQKLSLININNIISTFGGIKEIKVNSKEKEIINKFNENTSKLKFNNYLFQVLTQIPKILLELFVVIAIVFLLFYLLNSNMPSNEIIIFFGLLVGIFSRVMPSIYKLSSAFVNLNYYKPALDLLYDEIKNFNDEKNSSKLDNKLDIKSEKLSFKDSIKLKNLTFVYLNNNKTILKNANLTIKKGEKIGVYGESGSGKSTLVELLIGLLNPQEGEILVDDKNIINNKKNWFSKIGYVPQSIYLNDDTIKNNIFFYEEKKNNNSNKLAEIIKISQLKNIDINKQVGERGIQLSGGQKQRVGLARSLYKNSEILILDEATNALDKYNEENFLKSVFNIKSNKTYIIISHKKSLLDKCDRIISLENEKIVEIS
jgi:ATP-binding cassette, subfamily B, bacterial PglK